MLDRLTVEDFKPLEGSSFRVDELSIHLVLESVRTTMESERARLKRQPFSLTFRGPVESPLTQKIYSLTHDALGESLPIFLVPVGRNEKGFEYEAIFT